MKKLIAIIALAALMALTFTTVACAETDEEFWARMRIEYPEIFKEEFNWFAEMEPEPEEEPVDKGPIYEYRTPEFNPDDDFIGEEITIIVNY